MTLPWRQQISTSEDILESYILIISSFTVTLALKTANQSFLKTIWLIIKHHYTKFGSKRFGDSENIIWTNIHWHFEIVLWPWPWTQQSSVSIKHSGPWWNITIPSLVTKGSAAEAKLSRWTFTGILNLFCGFELDYNRETQSFHKTIQLMIVCHQTKFSCQRINSSDKILKSIFWLYYL